ncbi:Uncharacterised protein [uncultured archaeon]|nr:Uncharacterised protein [uncultured archaeon]
MTNLAKIADALGLVGTSQTVCQTADDTIKYIPYLEIGANGLSPDVLPRTTFARCFQPSTGLPCKPVCRTKSALNLIVANNNQYELFERDGVSSSCTIVPPRMVFADNYSVAQLRDLLRSQSANSLFNNYDTVVLTQSLCDYGFDFTKLTTGLFISDAEASKLYFGINSDDSVGSFLYDASKTLCQDVKPDVIQTLNTRYFSAISTVVPVPSIPG